ncbi:hypothetical protein EBZ39_00840 [bacterium]|nr:hypothetical protein [bacterium]
MKNKNQEQVDGNYYDAFIDSILSLPPKVRNHILNVGCSASDNNNPYLYLWNQYCIESENGTIHKLLDDHKLAID